VLERKSESEVGRQADRHRDACRHLGWQGGREGSGEGGRGGRSNCVIERERIKVRYVHINVRYVHINVHMCLCIGIGERTTVGGGEGPREGRAAVQAHSRAYRGMWLYIYMYGYACLCIYLEGP